MHHPSRHAFFPALAFASALLAGSLLVSCGGTKTPPVAAAAKAAPATAPAAAPVRVPEAEPEAPIVPRDNADFRITIGRADGSKTSGHVKRLERSSDWFGESDYTSDPTSLKVQVESDGKEAKFAWKEIKSISILPGKPASDVDCSYDSNFSPWMYDCTLKTTSKLISMDGKSWEITSREKWRLTFDNDSQVEFWLVKLPERMQDDRQLGLDDEITENYALYEKLQAEIRNDMKTMVTSIVVSP
jgi:hypothetical protein